MADVVTSNVLLNSNRHLAMRFTNVSDGTGEAGVVKVDATSATYAVTIGGNSQTPGIHLKLVRIRYDVQGGKVRLQWVATSSVDLLVVGGFQTEDFLDTGGIQCPPGLAGATGQISFTTVGFASNSTYSIEMLMTKGVPQF